MSFVILTKQGLEQRSASIAYMNTFSESHNSPDLILHFARLASKIDQRNIQIISEQRKIFNALGGESGFQKIIDAQHSGDVLQLSQLNKIVNVKQTSFEETNKKIQNILDTELQKEKKFQDYMLQSILRIEKISGKNIPEEKIRDLINILRQSSEEMTTIPSDDQLKEFLERAREESGKTKEDLQKKYQYLYTILGKQRDPFEIKQTANGYEIVKLDEKFYPTISKILPLMDDLIKHFKSSANDRTNILNKLRRWRTTSRSSLSKSYANIIKEIQSIEDISTQEKKKLQDSLHNAVAALIVTDQRKNTYNVSASLRGNLWEVTSAATYSLTKPIANQISENHEVRQFLSENIGHINQRKANIMMPLSITENKKKYFYKIDNIGKLIKTDKKELEEGEFLIKEISNSLKTVDGKIDRLEGYDVKINGETKRYYIAYSDKFKKYTSLSNLAVVGGTDPATHLNTPQPLNSNMGLFSENSLSEEVLFAILNKSTSSYIRDSMPGVKELENYVAQLFLDMAFDPKELEMIAQELSLEDLNSQNTLYVHSLGGGLMIPVFQTLEGMRIQTITTLKNHDLIGKIVSSSLTYGSSPDAKALMKMLGQTQPSDRWEWVASYVANSIQIQVELHLEQLFQIFGILPVQ